MPLETSLTNLQETKCGSAPALYETRVTLFMVHFAREAISFLTHPGGHAEGETVSVMSLPTPVGRKAIPSRVSTACFVGPSHASTSQSNSINQATGFCSEETIRGHYDGNIVPSDVKLHTNRLTNLNPPTHLYFSSSILELVILTDCTSRI